MARRASANFTWKNLASGVVLLNLADSTYFVLNETASHVWRGILRGETDEQLRQGLTEQFDCTPAQAGADFKELIAYMEGEGMLEAAA